MKKVFILVCIAFLLKCVQASDPNEDYTNKDMTFNKKEAQNQVLWKKATENLRNFRLINESSRNLVSYCKKTYYE